jgi:hypothetical protein
MFSLAASTTAAAITAGKYSNSASIIARSYNDDYDQDTGSTVDYDDDYNRPRSRRGYVPRDQGLSTLFGLVKNPKQVGGLCVLSGVALTFMGMMLFFEGNLLRLGNVRDNLGILFQKACCHEYISRNMFADADHLWYTPFARH